jgi:uncharacterized protein
MSPESLWFPLAGGLLIGTATALMLVVNGQVAGVSTMLGDVILPSAGNRRSKVSFVAGLLLGGVLLRLLLPQSMDVVNLTSGPLLVAAGLLVGFGTRLGTGCTSGHGVCGNSRFSVRSHVATATFIGVGMVAVFVARQVGVLS